MAISYRVDRGNVHTWGSQQAVARHGAAVGGHGGAAGLLKRLPETVIKNGQVVGPARLAQRASVVAALMFTWLVACDRTNLGAQMTKLLFGAVLCR